MIKMNKTTYGVIEIIEQLSEINFNWESPLGSSIVETKIKVPWFMRLKDEPILLFCMN